MVWTYSLDTALRTRKHGAHEPEVARGTVGALAHVLQAVLQLLAHGQGGDGLTLGGEGAVVAHLFCTVRLAECVGLMLADRPIRQNKQRRRVRGIVEVIKGVWLFFWIFLG